MPGEWASSAVEFTTIGMKRSPVQTPHVGRAAPLVLIRGLRPTTSGYENRTCPSRSSGSSSGCKFRHEISKEGYVGYGGSITL